ncbi:MAG: protein kinase [Gemmatimonadales bacterium]
MGDNWDHIRTAFADHYEFERELGAGGMATVYLARDIKHDRSVAIKVLRPELAAALGPDRFPREIRIVAKLSHPHILPLHDSGELDGFLYYVMPFVDGESLRAKLRREGPMPVHETVRILQPATAIDPGHTGGLCARVVARRQLRSLSFGPWRTDRRVDRAGGRRRTGAGHRRSRQ